ncbi:hypothetical protein Tco_1364502, partial [Tanacetum coccineum]
MTMDPPTRTRPDPVTKKELKDWHLSSFNVDNVKSAVNASIAARELKDWHLSSFSAAAKNSDGDKKETNSRGVHGAVRF